MISGDEKLSDVFSIFHDGVIASYRLDGNDLELVIEIKYLANRINPAFTKFFFRIFDPKAISLETWPYQSNAAPRKIEDISKIFSHEPEILSGECKGEKVEVAMAINDPSLDYSGGTLSFQADSGSVVDEGGKQYTLEELGLICEGYWAEWEAKWKRQPYSSIAWVVAKIFGFAKWVKSRF